MKNTLTLISNVAQPTLDDDIAGAYASRLEGTTGISWLADEVAVDIHFDGDLQSAKARLTESLLSENFDHAFQQTDRRAKSLLVADMDSTIIQCECIDELADFAGLKDKVSAITEAAMQGELDFEQALHERVALLVHMDAALLETVFEQRVKLTPGAETMVKTMNKRGATTVLVSGGFSFFTGKISEVTGFQVNRANVLAIEQGRLTGKIVPPVVDSQTKIDSLIEFREKAGLENHQTLAVGDGANDIPMIREAGLGVAFHPKPAAAEAANMTIRHADLTALLYLQGIADKDFA